MPEGPEVILTSQYLDNVLKNRYIIDINVISGRYFKNPNKSKKKILHGKNLIDNLKVKSVNSKGKFIYFTMKDENNENVYMLNTLGLSGNWSFEKDKYTRVIFTIKNRKNEFCLYFNDLRNFGSIEITKDKKILDNKLDKIATDILKSNISNDELIEKIEKINPKLNIVKVLMDQSKLVSGIGNYLVAEILYHSKIKPQRKFGDLTDKEIKNLAYSMRYISKLAYSHNSTGYMILFHNINMNEIYEEYHKDIKINKKFKFNVYRQKEDPKGNPILTDNIIKGRTIYYSKLQK